MGEARIIGQSKSVWQNIKGLLAAHTINITGALLFLLLAIFILWPLVSVLVKSIYGPGGLTLEYYKEFITKSYYYRSLYNSLLLGMMTTAVCITVGFCIAYMTTRGPVFLRTPIKVIAFLPLVAPPYLFALSLLILLGKEGIITRAFNLGWNIYGFKGCVISQTLAFLPLSYMMIENTLSSLNPNLEDSAANLGASEGKIIRSIIIPLLAPGFLKASLIIFVMAMAEFGNVALLSGRTPFLAPDTYYMIIGEADFNMASVLSVFLILPCAIIFIFQSYLIKGKSYTTILGKPVAAEPRGITRVIFIPFLAISLITCGFILATFGVVGIGAFMTNVGIDNTFTLNGLLDTNANQALVNSVKISLLAGLFGAMMGVALAYVIMRGKFRGRDVLEGISLSGIALPGTVLGVGYILAFNKPPFLLTGTMIILVICNVFRHLAIGEEAGITKLHQLSIEVEEASLNLGASAIRTFRKIVLPIIFPAFIYGYIYVLMRTMIGLSAVIFLVSPGYPLAAIFIFNMASFGQLGVACATTLKLMLIEGACLVLLLVSSKWTGLSIIQRGS
jgi:iron(III) transport system permease protein